MSPEDSSDLFDNIPSCLDSFRSGNFLVVLDDESRENEGDLILAAEDMTPAKMAFMVRFTSGIICTPLSGRLCDQLDLPLMVGPDQNSDPNRTAYTVTIDAEGVSTGISAADRALTCTTLGRGKMDTKQFRRPGHVLPLRARDGGVRVRQGHTEAAVELCRLTGKREAGVISEIVEEGELVEGTALLGGYIGMARRDGCLAFARRFGLKVCTIEALKEYVEEREGKLTNGAGH